MAHLYMIFPARNHHSVRGFSMAMWVTTRWYLRKSQCPYENCHFDILFGDSIYIAIEVPIVDFPSFTSVMMTLGHISVVCTSLVIRRALGKKPTRHWCLATTLIRVQVKHYISLIKSVYINIYIYIYIYIWYVYRLEPAELSAARFWPAG